MSLSYLRTYCCECARGGGESREGDPSFPFFLLSYFRLLLPQPARMRKSWVIIMGSLSWLADFWPKTVRQEEGGQGQTG